MYTVLIAEDEMWIRDALVEMVNNIERFTVVGEASNGIGAWDMIQQLWPCVLITDIMMPKRDGLELLDQIHELKVPLSTVIISGYDNFQYAQQCIRYGVTDYLLKPVKKEELQKTLNRSIGCIHNIHQNNKYFMQLQNFIDNMHDMDANKLFKRSNKLIVEILSLKKSKPDIAASLLRIYDSKLTEILSQYDIKNSNHLNLHDDESARAYFKELIEKSLHCHTDDKKNITRLIIKQTCDYIEKNCFSEDITLSEMAVRADLSESHFSYLFKRHTGHSLIDYTNDVKISKAKELLLEPDLKVYEIAEMVGYSSLTYFNRVFKGRTGFSPNEYRKDVCI